MFHRDIRAIRYDHGVGYMAVTDLQTGFVLMHGVNPALEGKPNPLDAATGKPISVPLFDAVRSADAGVTSYMFPKPGQTQPLRKVVAVAKFQPWDIVIYTGAYTDDLDAVFYRRRWHARPRSAARSSPSRGLIAWLDQSRHHLLAQRDSRPP